MKVLRSAAAAFLGLATLVAGEESAAQDRIRFQLSWRPQAEHGCYYQAVATGIYRRHNLDVTVMPGGPQINTQQILIAGRADFAMGSNSFNALNYVRNAIPMVVVGAVFQRNPTVIMTHQGVGLDSLEALRGKPIIVSSIARPTFWNFLRVRFGFTDEQIRPYTFNLAPFIADRTAGQQGFVTNEPYQLELQGVRVNTFLLADHGYNDYAYTIETSQRLVDERPELVQRFVDATIEGCVSYLGADPAPGNALIREANPDMTEAIIANSIRVMRARRLVDGDDAAQLGIGAMTDARWRAFFDMTVEAGLYPADLDYRRGYTLRFVNRRVGM
ncbi:MAG: ABC transporter substrate-binding protein [Alphaproteobacteria bacterium]|nr:ABC transporter substrate-binding protein [Alphaproteobacteria bacterium]